MSTNLPAQSLLALADTVEDAMAEWEYRDQHPGVDEPGEDLDGPELWDKLQRAREVYRAARALSPVTLEEALMDHLIAVEKSNDTEDRIAAMGAIITHGRTINARRLAGKGGGE